MKVILEGNDLAIVQEMVIGRYEGLKELLDSNPNIPNKAELKKDISSLESVVSKLIGIRDDGRASCGHRIWSIPENDDIHCAEMTCENYINKCSKCGIGGAR